MRKKAAVAAALIMLCGCGADVGSDRDIPQGGSSSATASDDTSAHDIPEAADSSSRPEMPLHLAQDDAVLNAAGGEFFALTGDRYPVYANTEVTYLPSGEDFYRAMLEELSQAEEFILLDYFIVRDGDMLDGLMETLEERAGSGVEVRLLCDGLEQNQAFAEKLSARGIDCRLFRDPDRISVNERDHRKLAVIDGKTAFVGSANISDEYINLTSPYGHWKDAAIMLRGEGVRSCTELFFEQWDSGSGLESCGEYLDKSSPAEAQGYVMPYGDSLSDGLDVSRDIFLEMISSAEDYLYITAPYLVIDDEFERALCSAAERGAEVVVIIPAIPDKRYMELLARPHYKPLVEAGVKLCRYDPGFIHSKVFVSDDRIAAVGSANLNNRSFYCDIECGALLIDTPCIADIKADILSTLSECTRLTADSIPELTAEEQLEIALFTQAEPFM